MRAGWNPCAGASGGFVTYWAFPCGLIPQFHIHAVGGMGHSFLLYVFVYECIGIVPRRNCMRGMEIAFSSLVFNFE